MNGKEWVTAGALAGIVGGAVLAAAIARSDGRRSKRIRKRLRREAKRLRKETRRLARQTEDWVERAQAKVPDRLAKPLDGAVEVGERMRSALTSRAAAARDAARGAARSARDIVGSADGSSAIANVYDRVRSRLKNMPWLANGAIYGALLHAVNTTGGRSLLGVFGDRGARGGAKAAAAQRLGVHLAYGVVAALAFEALQEWRRQQQQQH